MPDTPDSLLRALAESPSHPYPRPIIEQMIQQREEMIPALLGVLEDALKRPKHYLEGENWKPFTFACYLLAQFRVAAAFKPMCALLGLSAKMTDELFGDMITEDMGNILASVYDGDDRPLRDLAENPKAYEYVRGATVPKCYLSLILTGKISRVDVERYAEELLSTKLERKPGFVWDGWTGLCADLGFARLVPLIEKAIEDDLCDPMYYGFEDLIRNAESGKDEHWKRRAGLVDDTLKATEWWHCWQKEPKRKPLPPLPPSPPLPKYVDSASAPKVGRNDPCPCGSGKKFKKCCGGAG